MSEYPEHIDQIDDFYRSQLADHEIEPPEGLWDKISLSVFETQSPDATAAIDGSSVSASLLTNAQKIIGLGSAALLIVAGLVYFYTSNQEVKPTEDNTLPSIEQPTEELNNDHINSREDNSDQTSTSPSSERKNTPSNTTKEDKSLSTPNAMETPVNEIPEEAPAVINNVPQEQKTDSIADIKTTQKAPKEKVKFKDKYKKEYQDSTRKIFVPGK